MESTQTDGSAPSVKTKTLLLTIVGSVAAEHDLTLWKETYVRALVDLGAGTAAARQSLARAVDAGWFEPERVGRRVRLHVRPEHRAGLAAASARVAEFATRFDWNGEWLIVMLKVPEEARAIRHHFRTELGWLGFGSLGNGVWISPHTENEEATLRLLATTEGPRDAHVFRSARSIGTTPEELATSAWDMPSLRNRYDTFLARFRDAAPETPVEHWTAWVELTTAWRHFPLFDPDLPEHLLPADWPRTESHRLYRRLDARWRDPALEHVLAIERSINS